MFIIFWSWLLALLIVAAEFYVWLQTAQRPRWFTDAVLSHAHNPQDLTSWLLFPSSWLGLHSLVMWVVGLPLSGAVFVIGTALGTLKLTWDAVHRAK